MLKNIEPALRRKNSSQQAFVLGSHASDPERPAQPTTLSNHLLFAEYRFKRDRLQVNSRVDKHRLIGVAEANVMTEVITRLEQPKIRPPQHSLQLEKP